MLESFLHIDQSIFDFINQGLSNQFFDWLMPYVRNKYTWLPLYVVLLIFIFKKWKLQGFYIVLLALLLIGSSDGLSSHVLKPLFARTRPCLLPGFMDHVRLLLERCSGAYSLPSSHAANHFALAVFIGGISNSRVLKFGLLFWACLICFAQVYVGVHFPIDVLLGAILGALLAWGFLQIQQYFFKH